MTVYVDDMYLYPMGQFGRMKMSHMIADTYDELHAMAERLGQKRAWFQGDHYDVSMSIRAKAIRFGAVPVELRQLACMSKRQKWTGHCGPSEEAIEWRHALSLAYDMDRALGNGI